MIFLRCISVIVIMLITLVGGIFFCYQEGLWPIFPINVVQIIAPLRYVSSNEVEDLLMEANIQKNDFFYIDMQQVKHQLKQNYWIEDINIARVWPDKIRIKFAEQEPLAYWGDKAVITKDNCEIIDITQVQKAQNTFSALPILIGNEKNSQKLCDTLENLKISIKPIGIEIKKLVLSPRGSWYLELTNGLIVLLGKKDIIDRMDKFVKFFISFNKTENLPKEQMELITDGRMLDDKTSKISYIDMRYNKGLAIAFGQTKKLAELMESA